MSRCYFICGSRKEMLCLHSPENNMYCRTITAIMACGCHTVVKKYGHVGRAHIRRSVSLSTKRLQFSLLMCR